MSVKNIVLFGQTGAGKSSVVNLIAGEERAKTSPDMERCTMHWEEYPIAFDGCNYKVFDTVGLVESQLKIDGHLDAIADARTLVTKLENEGGIDLLLFCVRPTRFTSTIESNYRRFCIELLRKKKIPIVLLVTALEDEQIMENWWTRNKGIFERSKIVVNDHACIIAADLGGRYRKLHEESRQLVRKLVRKYAQGAAKNIVLFGQTGAGKSSVINLMAGENRAKTSLGTERCTLGWKEYPITFGEYNYRVFDTIGLEEPQLGINEYLDAIYNARSLIMKLKDEDGIDLLLFCVRAGRLSATVQNNYRLFYEWLCEKKVPIVIVITGLESEANMEGWWIEHKGSFDRLNIVVDGHACITAINLGGNYERLYEESRALVRNIVQQYTRGRPRDGYKGGEGWFKRFMRLLRELIIGNPDIKKKDIVTVLTKRCGMPMEAALELAKQVREDFRQR